MDRRVETCPGVEKCEIFTLLCACGAQLEGVQNRFSRSAPSGSFDWFLVWFCCLFQQFLLVPGVVLLVLGGFQWFLLVPCLVLLVLGGFHWFLFAGSKKKLFLFWILFVFVLDDIEYLPQRSVTHSLSRGCGSKLSLTGYLEGAVQNCHSQPAKRTRFKTVNHCLPRGY